MKAERPLILISNDDGYTAKGINCLVEYVRQYADILVCAPNSPRSGFSCAFSATEPLRLQKQREEDGLQVYSSNGTPTDCVKLALAVLLKRKPDLILAGINHGDNASVNSHYSGTMGVAMEGAMKNIPSIAYSLCCHDEGADFGPLKPYIQHFTRCALRDGMREGVCLNINFPVSKQFAGIKVCRMANGVWENEVVACHHPRGYDYYWMVGNYSNREPEREDTDNWALQHNFVAVTPTTFDVTAYEAFRQTEQWAKER